MLLHGTHPMPGGGRVRLRLPLAGDRDGLHELLAWCGLAAEDLDVRRALRCVPGRRAVVVATAWDGLRHRLAGFGALDPRDGALTLIAPPEVAELLREALREQAGTWRRRVA